MYDTRNKLGRVLFRAAISQLDFTVALMLIFPHYYQVGFLGRKVPSLTGRAEPPQMTPSNAEELHSEAPPLHLEVQTFQRETIYSPQLLFSVRRNVLWIDPTPLKTDITATSGVSCAFPLILNRTESLRLNLRFS